jgi:formylglycine-generating enzyme required for sulfatase activity
MRPIITPFILCLAASGIRATPTIDWVTIGNPSNKPDAAGLGSVRYVYSISRNEISISQYAEFLNAVASVSDQHFLYTTSMGWKPADVPGLGTMGIQRDGGPGDYGYKEIGSGQRPICYVSWFRAARYCNWLHNGCKTGAEAAGTTEDGAYTLRGAQDGIILKNPEAKFWIPTEDEWHKAAYYDPTLQGGSGGYWLSPTRSNSIASNLFSVPGAANLQLETLAQVSNGLTSFLTDGGAYGPDSQTFYGINDMAGNVQEWIDAVVGGDSRGIRGGSWSKFSTSQKRPGFEWEDSLTGFRIAGYGMAVLSLLDQSGAEIVGGSGVGGFTSIRSVRRFTVVNNGAGVLSGLGSSIEGAAAGDFSVTPIIPQQLIPGARADIEVRFAPTVQGPRTAELRVSSDQQQQPLVVKLEGDDPMPSEAWRLANFGSPENIGDGADSSDPDRDGISNIVEFSLGSNPNVPSADLGEIVKNGSVLEYRYWRAKAAVSEMSFVREFASSPNGPWQQTGGTAETIISDDGVRQRVLVTTPASSAIERRFVRLRVTRR